MASIKEILTSNLSYVPGSENCASVFVAVNANTQGVIVFGPGITRLVQLPHNVEVTVLKGGCSHGPVGGPRVPVAAGDDSFTLNASSITEVEVNAGNLCVWFTRTTDNGGGSGNHPRPGQT